MSWSRRDFLRTAGLGAAALLGGRLAAGAEGKRPNVIFIMADDMGFGDAACNNEFSKIPTPNLDRIAQEGIRFTDAHTPSAVCTPTRYGVVTGRYPWRTQMKRGVLGGYSTHLINPERLTVAGLMKQNGYHTAVVGKWHLGMDWAKTGEKVDYSKPATNGPNALGFDFSYVVPASLDMPPYVFVKDGRATETPTAKHPGSQFPVYIRAGEMGPNFDMEGCLDHLVGQSAQYIAERAKAAKPFFLYFPLTAPHKPVAPHKRFQGKSGLGPYGDFVIQVDWTVGQVLKALDTAGITDDTLLFYTSDNGSFMFRLDEKDATDHVDDASIQKYRADRHRANYIFRGTKADIWEGGHHVPFLARWPGKIEAGATCGATICLTDFMATCADLVGATLPKDAGEDSFSVLPLLLGKQPPKPRPPVIHQSGSGMLAIRDGRWKLVVGNGSGGREKPAGKWFEKPYQLFDIQEDISEKNNVAEKHPEIVERLYQRFKAIHEGGRSDV